MPIHRNTKRADPTKAGKGQTLTHLQAVNRALRAENEELRAEIAALRRQIAEGGDHD